MRAELMFRLGSLAVLAGTAFAIAVTVERPVPKTVESVVISLPGSSSIGLRDLGFESQEEMQSLEQVQQINIGGFVPYEAGK